LSNTYINEADSEAFLKKNKLVGVMVLGHPKIIKDHVLEKYINTYAKTNLKFDGKWTDPLSPTKKVKKNKNL
jgi:hypothetical protein